METLLLPIIISILISFMFFKFFFTKKPSINLPPGPKAFPIIGSLLWPRKSFGELEPLLRSLRAKYGPIFTLHFGSRPAIFILDRTIAHQALIQNGAICSDRPPSLDDKGHSFISTSSYGPTWRFLRRNLISEVLHPSRLKAFSATRKWVLDDLIQRLELPRSNYNVLNQFRFSIENLLVSMCFGKKLEEEQVLEIMEIHRRILSSYTRVSLLNLWPKITKILFRKQWEEFFRVREKHFDIMLPYIKDIKTARKPNKNNDEKNVAYVDTLLDLKLPDQTDNLNDEHIIGLCSEFINGGTDTTSSALQWIMANLVKHQEIQERLYKEMKEVVSDRFWVTEDDLQKLPYVKAVVLEGLRRNPPGDFVLPHGVSEDFILNGYLVPKEGTLNVMTVDMGLDVDTWDEPLGFKPERFLEGKKGEVLFDITGSKEIKMMPFGVGRRICPGYGLAMLHLEYFVSNLVWKFKWNGVEGDDDVDMEIKHEFSVMMKNPLKVKLSPRF